MCWLQYTPLLPAVAVGTMEEGSIVEPVRKILGGKVCVDIYLPSILYS
jgi:NADH dehydrogenase FAD-containing subunit